MRCFLPNLRFFLFLALCSRRAPERGYSQQGQLLVAHGDVMGIGFSPPSHGESPSLIAQLWRLITRAFPLQLFKSSSFPEAPCCRQSVTVTSLARHQPNVAAPAPAVDPEFSGKGSTVGPPMQQPYQPMAGECRSPPQPHGPPISLFSRHKITHSGNSEAGSLPAALIIMGRGMDQAQTIDLELDR